MLIANEITDERLDLLRSEEESYPKQILKNPISMWSRIPWPYYEGKKIWQGWHLWILGILSNDTDVMLIASQAFSVLTQGGPSSVLLPLAVNVIWQIIFRAGGKDYWKVFMWIGPHSKCLLILRAFRMIFGFNYLVECGISKWPTKCLGGASEVWVSGTSYLLWG